MKLFIWNRIYELTDNYHPEGGLLVIAEDLENAKNMEPKINSIKPDYVYDVIADKPLKIIFPDAGCC